MSIATLTSKGQVTIPKDVRTKLHLEAGEKISFQVDEANGSACIVPLDKTVDEVFGILRNSSRSKPVSVETMNEAIEEKFRKEFP